MQFSFLEYKKIIRAILLTGKYKDYKDINEKTERFILLRHDVEFSVDRAYSLSLLEDTLGIITSYFFQLRNNTHNILSLKNRSLIRDIYNRGHHIGIHVHIENSKDINDVIRIIKKDTQVMEDYLRFEIDRFSFHRPNEMVLQEDLHIKGLINVYNHKFFHFDSNIKSVDSLCIKYLSDSMHRWKYGYPSDELLNRENKIHVLIHPYSWTKKGYNNLDNFKTLLQEKYDELKITINNETKHFKEVIDEL